MNTIEGKNIKNLHTFFFLWVSAQLFVDRFSNSFFLFELTNLIDVGILDLFESFKKTCNFMMKFI